MTPGQPTNAQQRGADARRGSAEQLAAKAKGFRTSFVPGKSANNKVAPGELPGITKPENQGQSYHNRPANFSIPGVSKPSESVKKAGAFRRAHRTLHRALNGHQKWFGKR